MTALNRHGQPLIAEFNARRNRDKALYSLLGLCRGLIADQTINPREVLFLDTWLRNHPQLHDDPDGRDLLCCIADILHDNRIDAEELDDLRRLIETVLHYHEVTPGEADEINLLLGLLTGLSADHHINTVETQFLHQWLARNTGLRETYPASVVHDVVTDILADGIVTDAEKKSLIQLLHSIVGNRYEQTGIACGLSTEFCCQYIDSLEHADRLFCITGALSLGSRSKAIELIDQRGGRTTNAITKTLDVLIIGAIASRDWRFTSHGRKIEQAINAQRSGQPLLIISERTWKQFL